MYHRKYGVNQLGISLVEVMVVIAIIAVLVLFATPSIMQAVPNYQLRSLSYQILGVGQKARSLAVQSNTRTRILFSEYKGYEYVLLQVDSNRTGSFTDPDLSSLDDQFSSGSQILDLSINQFQNDNSENEVVSITLLNAYGLSRFGFTSGRQCGYADKKGDFTNTIEFRPQGTSSSSRVYVENGQEGTKNTACYRLDVVPAGSLKIAKYTDGYGWK